MARRKFPLAPALALLVAIAVLPLAGAALGQRDLSAYFRFPPPLEIPRDYARWSWIAAALVLLPFGLIALSWILHGSALQREHLVRDRSLALPTFPGGPTKRFPL